MSDVQGDAGTTATNQLLEKVGLAGPAPAEIFKADDNASFRAETHHFLEIADGVVPRKNPGGIVAQTDVKGEVFPTGFRDQLDDALKDSHGLFALAGILMADIDFHERTVETQFQWL